MSIKRCLLQGSILSVLITYGAAGAQAADPNDVAARLKAAFAEQGVTLSWRSVSGNDASMVLSGVTASTSASTQPAEIGDVTLSGVSEENGGYRINKVTMPDYSVTKDGTTLDATGIEISGLRLPAQGKNDDPMAGLMLYDHARIQDINVKKGGDAVFDASNCHVDITPPSGDNPLKFTGAVDHFTADLSATKDPKAKAVIQALGYETIDGSADMAGSWSPSNGRMDIDKYEVAVKNAGTLAISLDMSGYTRDFIKSVHRVRMEMAAHPQKKNSAQGLVLLGLLQQLSFTDAKISFTDDSLTGKVIDYLAAKQNMRREDIINQAKAVLPFALAKMHNPEFSAKVTAAVSKFLDDPKNLTIKAAPPSPLSLGILIAGAMAAPEQIPNQLGVTVTANQ
ncbi:MAG TPA: hypothetical protein VHC00_17420 [Rhizobiaceae bacterium]|nr:hypothetical protein [Rhizobiaceae bacterium]